MPYDLHDTIAAIATAAGGAARGVIRLSGPHAIDYAISGFTTFDGAPPERLRRSEAVVGHAAVHLAGQAHKVPCNMLLWPSSRSYTRQPLAELHLPGSPPILDALLGRLCSGGARLAEPGEFTLRAFLAGRIDLTQAEAVLGVIDAPSAADYNAALAQLAGGLATPLGTLRNELLHLLAELEAGLDFADEDIQFISRAEIATRLSSALEPVRAVDRQLATRLDVPTVFRVVLTGPPNVGKSSLFNALVKRFGLKVPYPAIISASSGTTRDYLVADLNLGGVRCQLIDTAGLTEGTFDASTTPSEIHHAAQSHAAAQGRQATLQLLCSDSRTTLALQQDRQLTLSVLTKADLVHDADQDHEIVAKKAIVTSSHSGQGLAELADAIRTRLAGTEPESGSGAVYATASRCRESVRLATSSLATALQLAQSDGGDELIAAEVRTALDELGKVVGAVSTDDLLDRIFSAFCIGK